MSTPLYCLRNITQTFAGRQVLCVDQLDMAHNTAYALLGPNGAGKTTLMRILAFLDTPTSGELFYKSERVNDAAKLRSNAVWVPQSPVMFTGTLQYNIEYPMRIKGMDADTRRIKARELLELVHLQSLATAPAHYLSGGETQRAGIARALATGATVLLFDEPTANIDQRSREDFIELIKRLKQECSLSLVIATHDASLALTVCSEQIHLEHGKQIVRCLLPDGTCALPARLEGEQADWRIVLSCNTHLAPYYSVRGITESASGIALRLTPQCGNDAAYSPPSTEDINVIVTSATCRKQACSFTLGQRIQAAL